MYTRMGSAIATSLRNTEIVSYFDVSENIIDGRVTLANKIPCPY